MNASQRAIREAELHKSEFNATNEMLADVRRELTIMPSFFQNLVKANLAHDHELERKLIRRELRNGRKYGMEMAREIEHARNWASQYLEAVNDAAKSLKQAEIAWHESHLYAADIQSEGVNLIYDNEDYDYISDALDKIPSDHDVIMIAPKGTGKTVAMQKLSTANDAYDPEQHSHKIIAVGELIANVKNAERQQHLTYFKDLHEKVALCNGKSYIARNYHKTPRLAITAKSLHHAEGLSAGTLFIDEVNEVYTGTTNGLAHDPKRSNLALEQIQRHSGRVVIAGADITQADIDLFRMIRGLDKPVYIIHRPARPQDTPLYRHKTVAGIIHAAIASAFQGTTTLAVHTKLEADAAIELAISHGIPKDKILNIRAETDNDPKVQAFFKDTDLALNYALIVYTVKMSSGVSIDCPIHATYGVFSHPGVTAETSSQMLHRVRNAQSYHYYIVNGSGIEPATTEQELYDNLLARHDVDSPHHIQTALKSGDEELISQVESAVRFDDHDRELQRLSAIHALRNQHGTVRIADRFRLLESLQGYNTIIELDDLPEPELIDAFNAMKEQAYINKRQARVGATPIDDKELGELVDAQEATEEAFHGNAAYHILQDLPQINELTEEVYDRFHNVKDRQRIRRAHILLANNPQLAAEFDMRNMLSQKLLIYHKRHRAKLEIVEEIIALLVPQMQDTISRIMFLTQNKMPVWEINEALDDWCIANERRYRQTFDLYKKGSMRPTLVFRTVFREIDLPVEEVRGYISKEMTKQVNDTIKACLDKSNRFYSYCIDMQEFIAWIEEIAEIFGANELDHRLKAFIPAPDMQSKPEMTAEMEAKTQCAGEIDWSLL